MQIRRHVGQSKLLKWLLSKLSPCLKPIYEGMYAIISSLKLFMHSFKKNKAWDQFARGAQAHYATNYTCCLCTAFRRTKHGITYLEELEAHYTTNHIHMLSPFQ
jgi:hypothetical protein